VPENDSARTSPPDEIAPEQADDAREEAKDSVSGATAEPHEPTPEETGQAKDVEGKCDSQIEHLQAELEEAKSRALRSQAELENYRKRIARQMDDERRYANIPLMRDLLPVWDNMGRAIEAAENNHDTASLLEGFKMVAGQLESVLERHHCSKIEALGRPFDPSFHEAISQQPSKDQPVNTVLHVAETGFQVHGRVVRPSRVVVSVAVPEPERETEPDRETGGETSAAEDTETQQEETQNH
jgi:molecular chaperone GrpE